MLNRQNGGFEQQHLQFEPFQQDDSLDSVTQQSKGAYDNNRESNDFGMSVGSGKPTFVHSRERNNPLPEVANTYEDLETIKSIIRRNPEAINYLVPAIFGENPRISYGMFFHLQNQLALRMTKSN